MTSAHAKSIRQKNGEIVVSAMRSINKPTTIANIVKYISETHQVQSDQIQEAVQKVLEKGVEYGFVRRQGGKYTVEESSDEDDEEMDDLGKLEDRNTLKNRARSKLKSTGRSRSRSRSRRRSSKKRKR